MNLKNIYNNALYERYNNPQYTKNLISPNANSGIYNPSCGDKVQIEIEIKNNIITAIAHKTEGCVISIGSADLICEYMLHKNSNAVNTLTPEKIFEIIGIKLGPNRLKCAFITVEALQNATQSYYKNE